MKTLTYFDSIIVCAHFFTIMKIIYEGELIFKYDNDRGKYCILVKDEDFGNALVYLFVTVNIISENNKEGRKRLLRELDSPKEMIKRALENSEKEIKNIKKSLNIINRLSKLEGKIEVIEKRKWKIIN